MNGYAMSVKAGFVIKTSQTVMTTVLLVSAVQLHMSLHLQQQRHILYITHNSKKLE